MRNPLPYVSWCFQVTNLPNSVLRVGMVSLKPALISKCPFLAKIKIFILNLLHCVLIISYFCCFLLEIASVSFV